MRLTKQEFIKLQKKLKTDQAIAKKFGISRQAVHQWRKKFGVGFIKNKNKSRNETIRALYNSNVPVVKIAKKFGLSISQVYRIL